MSKIDKKFTVMLQGKEFITFEGLLNAFHENKGKTITTEIVSITKPYVFKATAQGEKGTYTAHGDADDTNVSGFVKQHIIRMAETRAIARALRLYNNIGMCSAEELGEDKEEHKQVQAKQTEACTTCGAFVPEKVYDFSMSKFKKSLCFDCQKKQSNATVTKKTAKLEKDFVTAKANFAALSPEEQKAQALQDSEDLFGTN
jgi:hypothetical protein